ncbi:hypothetical protein Tco_1170576, partial [Tanacetum coccineum]
MISKRLLSNVTDYRKKHVEKPKDDDKGIEEDLNSCDVEFLKVDQCNMLCDHDPITCFGIKNGDQ